jgi:mRNA interferase MazF
MEMTRGAIVMAGGPGEGAEGLRPFVVVQSDIFTESHNTLTVCPLTANVGGEALFRVAFSPLEHTGLSVECEVQVDRILSIRRERVARVIGRASATRMEQVDQALRRWLAL